MTNFSKLIRRAQRQAGDIKSKLILEREEDSDKDAKYHLKVFMGKELGRMENGFNLWASSKDISIVHVTSAFWGDTMVLHVLYKERR